jgi:hypothetical protein
MEGQTLILIELGLVALWVIIGQVEEWYYTKKEKSK